MVSDVRDCLDAFVSWFRREGGYLHASLEYAFEPNRGVHLRVATDAKAIPCDTLILKCPHHLSVSALNARNVLPLFPSDSFSPLPEHLVRHARPQFQAALFLVAQRQVAQSRWRPYLNILPELASSGSGEPRNLEGLGVIDPPYCWDARARSWLQGTQLEKGVDDLESLWKKDWAHWEDDVLNWANSMKITINWSVQSLRCSLSRCLSCLCDLDPVRVECRMSQA